MHRGRCPRATQYAMKQSWERQAKKDLDCSWVNLSYLCFGKSRKTHLSVPESLKSFISAFGDVRDLVALSGC